MDVTTPMAAGGGANTRARRTRIALSAGATASLLLVGGAVGWRLASGGEERPVRPVEVELSQRPVTSSGDNDLTVVTPDVVGMDAESARSVMLDAGVAADAVTVTEVDHVAAPGAVVRQDPARGTREPTAIVIEVARAAVMPDLVGRPAAEVVAALRSLGVSVTTSFITSGGTVGAVVSTTPAAGQPLVATAAVVSVAPPESVSLAGVRADQSQCDLLRSGNQIGGVRSRGGFACSIPNSGQRRISYQLTAGLERLTATVGVLDSSPPGTTAEMDVIVDGVVAQHLSLVHGTPGAIDVALAGHVGVVIQLNPPVAPNPTSGNTPTVGISEPRVSGTTDAIVAFIEGR